MRKEDVQKLVDTKQFFAAVWRVVDADDSPFEEDHLKHREVCGIVTLAMRHECWPEVRKIVRQFERFFKKYEDQTVYDEAQLELNGITIPENIEDLDEAALLP